MNSRRIILKSIGLIGLSAALTPFERVQASLRAAQTPVAFPDRWNGEPLGRIAQSYQPARAEPTTQSDIVTEMRRDDMVRVRRVVQGEKVFGNSELWLETAQGYLYASFVQPMRFHLPQPPTAELGEGRWAEVIVPVSGAYKQPNPFDEEEHRGNAYYGSVFRVAELVTGEDGKRWYRVPEMYQTVYLRATHLRLIDESELTPISPELEPQEKRLDVNLNAQTIVAYERGEPVWANFISSGVTDYETPEGTHYVWDKRISERMVADENTATDDPDYYNLPGVPFVCYFTDNWVGTHGTYWHNDYGRPRSHGCVNLTPEAARWLWRWTTPQASLDEFYTRPTNRLHGTRVDVHY